MRTPAINPSCKPFPNKRVVLVTPNMEYWEMFLNWHHYAKPLMAKEDQLVVLAQDEAVATKLRETKKFVFVDLQGNLHGAKSRTRLFSRLVMRVVRRLRAASTSSMGNDSLLGPWGSYDFNHLTGKRPGQILQFLRLECTVLYTDIDNVWLGDVYSAIGEQGAHDLYIADDSGEEGGHNLCSCFLYLQPSQPVMELVQTWADAVSDHDNDQAFFNQVMKGNGESVDYKVLPYSVFPPGAQADRYFGDPTMRVLHANYRIGLDAKKQFLVDHKKWAPLMP